MAWIFQFIVSESGLDEGNRQTMLDSEKLGIAAHLHVLLRRKTGRVTDTEWMAINSEYAREIIRFARAKAVEENHDDLQLWADKLAAVFDTKVTPEPNKPLLAKVFTSDNLDRYVKGLR